MYTPISKNVVGENDECQLSKGDCTTEMKCRYWISIENIISRKAGSIQCRPLMASHMVCPYSSESVAEASFFLGVRERIVERDISKFLSKGHVKPLPVSRSHGSISFAQREELIVFAYQTWKPVSFGRAISVRQLLFAVLSDNVFWNRCIWFMSWEFAKLA